MDCPKCKVNLKTSDLGEFGFVILDVCPECEGAWFDKGELDKLDDSVWTDVEKVDFTKIDGTHKDLKCPKCNENLEPLSPADVKELVVDRCLSCSGFWLDKNELDQMRDVAMDKDVEESKKMKHLTRPAGWSTLKWSVHCFKECYFKK